MELQISGSSLVVLLFGVAWILPRRLLRPGGGYGIGGGLGLVLIVLLIVWLMRGHLG